ncbi:MAG: UDP-N-acetylmuramoyl-tripeptide--D-alanyl-D-alanine ligase [Phycisphaerales bacterium]
MTAPSPSSASEFWRPHRLAEAARARPLSPAMPLPPHTILGVSIDSRTIEPAQAFIAIHGPRFDGHDYITNAIERGASLIIADKPDHPAVADSDARDDRPPILIVDDTRRALARLAAAYRQALPALVIAVTGSNGKTSTVRFIDAAFRAGGWRTHSSIKSFNNDIGVPLTILAAPPDTEALICEIGMNNPGEIEPLARIAAPNAALVTTIGRAHIGHLGSVSAIAREKLSILRGLRPTPAHPSPLALIPALGAEPGVVDLALEDLREDGALRDIDLRRVRAGEGHGIRWSIQSVSDADHTTTFRVEDDHLQHDNTLFKLPFPGATAAANAALAVTIARWANIADDRIAQGLLAARLPEQRMTQATATRPDALIVRAIDDCYNASPESMLAALIEADRQATAAGARRILILGEMGETGHHAEPIHREIATAIRDRPLIRQGDAIIAVGEATRWLIEELSDIAGVHTQHFPSNTPQVRAAMLEAIDRIVRSTAPEPPTSDPTSPASPGPTASPRPHVIVLIKGSRSVGLDALADAALHAAS